MRNLYVLNINIFIYQCNQVAQIIIIDVFGSSKGRNRYFFKSFVKFWIEDCVWNHILFDVRLNANIKHTSGINLASPSLIRRSHKVRVPQKWSNCAYGGDPLTSPLCLALEICIATNLAHGEADMWVVWWHSGFQLQAEIIVTLFEGFPTVKTIT